MNATLCINFDAKRPVEDIHRALAMQVLIRGRREMAAPEGRKRFAFEITALGENAEVPTHDALRAALGGDTRLLSIWHSL
jgi:hypothetical protein